MFETKNSDKITALGRSVADLPRYLGQGWFLSEDGVTVPSTMHLLVTGLNDDNAGISATGTTIFVADGLVFKLKIELNPAIE